MLEWIKEAGTILPDNPDTKRHLYCFIGSFLFHAAVIILVILLFKPVEFHVYEKVTPVFIAPPVKLPLSSLDRLFSEGEGPWPETAGREGQPEPSGAGEGRGAGTDLAGMPIRALEPGAASKGGTASLPPEMVSKFRLDPSQKEESRFTLNINPEQKQTSEPGGQAMLDTIDVRSILQKNALTARPLRTYPPGKPRIGLPSRGRSAAGLAVEYDISPWAEDAVARIQRNWLIPAVNGDYEKRAVEITVVIAKSGELLSASIRNSSSKSYLDAAALNAIKMSTPFPALPEDFPLERLEADLLFQYYE